MPPRQPALDLPRLGLGTWSIFDTDRDMAWLVGEALASGVRLFDSSPMYGRAEKSLAASLGDRRGEAIIATKVSAAEADVGLAQIDYALSLFGFIDLLQIHNIVGWRVHLPELVRLKYAGRIGAIGASQGLLVSDASFEEVMRTGVLDSIQVRYNPLRQQAAERLLPLAQDLGIAVIVMQPLRWGVLLADPNAEELAALGVGGWGMAVLRWILSDPRVTCVLNSTSTPGRIADNAQAAALGPFDVEQRRLFDRILCRGARKVTPRERSSTELAGSLQDFLSQRLGAGYCSPCLAREFMASAQAIDGVREGLACDRFAQEEGDCLMCGNRSDIVRSRTIMR